MELKRLELGDSDYALALSEMTHRTHKIIEKLWEDAKEPVFELSHKAVRCSLRGEDKWL